VSGPPHGCALRRVATPALLLALTCATAACTADPDPGEQPSSSTTASSSAPPAPSVPLRTKVTHVAGKLPAKDRRRLSVNVGRTISAYADAAFLDGHYPRSTFGSSFGAFTRGAAARARHDVSMLTNQPLGATTRSVRATRRTAFLSVLAPRGKVAGVTAAVDLVFRVDRGDAAGRRVHLKGRLLLTPTRRGTWAVFGYELSRSSTPVGSGS
jgi:hypothetical protein